MHGYQLMQAIADRTRGRWTPSPGAVYPTINQLEDEGLVTVIEESGRRLVTLTDLGREQAEAARAAASAPFDDYAADDAGPDLRALLEQLHVATRLVSRAGTDTQRQAAAKALDEARRSLYLILAEGSEGGSDGGDD
jgi:DNA-binding PadR family transcriptional regulator